MAAPRCPECDCEEVEPVEDDVVMCMDCAHEFTAKPENGDGRRAGFLVGLVQQADKVPGKDKLLKLLVDTGRSTPLQIVTNAPNVKQGSRIVVAKEGALIGDPDDGEIVKAGTVAGCKSEGVVCDNSMLGWGSANKGRAVVLSDAFSIGSAPPAEKPRGS